LIRTLTSGETIYKVGALLTISWKPTGDPRLLPLIEQHLDDRTLCVISAPTQYAEVRLIAVQALVAECKKQNIKRFINLEDVVEPLDTPTYSRLRRENNLQAPLDMDIIAGRIKVLEELRRLGKLSTVDIEGDA
jgi:hypothetical protein